MAYVPFVLRCSKVVRDPDDNRIFHSDSRWPGGPAGRRYRMAIKTKADDVTEPFRTPRRARWRPSLRR